MSTTSTLVNVLLLIFSIIIIVIIAFSIYYYYQARNNGSIGNETALTLTVLNAIILLIALFLMIWMLYLLFAERKEPPITEKKTVTVTPTVSTFAYYPPSPPNPPLEALELGKASMAYAERQALLSCLPPPAPLSLPVASVLPANAPQAGNTNGYLAPNVSTLSISKPSAVEHAMSVASNAPSAVASMALESNSYLPPHPDILRSL